tara:strand:- start:8412 stop:10142 length:1731 start_codon:yes stop_codon:yes gene_type:complete
MVLNFILSIFLTVNANLFQEDLEQKVSSLNDSLLIYKNSDPDKAIAFGFEVFKISDYNNPSVKLLSVNTLVGEILASRNLDAEALDFYNESLKMFQAIDKEKRKEKEVKLPPWVLLNIGNIYFSNKNFIKAEKFYKKAFDNFSLYNNLEAKGHGFSTVYDNLAMIELNRNNYEQAEMFYLKAYEIRKNNNKIEDLIYSNLGLISLNMKRNDLFKINTYFSEIQKLFDKEKMSIKADELSKSYLFRNYAYSFTLLGKYYHLEKNYKAAIDYYSEALELLRNFPVDLPLIESNIAECYLKLNKLNKALSLAENNLRKIKGNFFSNEKKRNFKILEEVYRKRKDFINLIRVKDSLLSQASLGSVLDIGEKFNELESNLLLTQKRSELIQNKIQYNTYLYILIIGATILFFSLVSLRLNFNLQKEKTEKTQNEKKMLENQLNHKKIQLINKSNYISQRNKNLNYLHDSIEKNKLSKTSRDPSKLIQDKIKMILNSEKINNRFEQQFEEVYPEFFKNLIFIESKLTQQDLKICAYLKMNQNTQEIAQLTGSSIRTVESQKYRLKKKLSLKNINLITFLHSI